MSNSTVILTAVGLNKEPNQLSLPDGSLTVAENVVIKRDNVLESRRGYALYGTEFGTSTDRASQLLTYKNRILRHYNNTLSFDSDDAGTFLDFAGNYSQVTPGLRIKGIASNGNYYFTTNAGVQKISAASATDFTTNPNFITQAGGIPAIDLSTSLNYKYGDQSDFFLQDSAVAYRIVWGYNDANNNLILGSPSQRSVIFNPLNDLLLADYERLLVALDNLDRPGSMINAGNYASTLGVTAGTSATTLLANLEALAEKLDNQILYADNVSVAPLQISGATLTADILTINFSSGNPELFFTGGNNVYLSGFAASLTGTLDGPQVVALATTNSIEINVTATGTVGLVSPTITSYTYGILTPPAVPADPPADQDLVNLQLYLQSVMTHLLEEPNAVIPSGLLSLYISTLDITTTATVNLNITIPQGIVLNQHFYQIYRSNVFQATGTTVLLTEVVPDDELQLVYEGFPSQTDLNNGFVNITDITPDAFKGADLYTNPSSGQGIAQSNNIPPLAQDINFFKNTIFYANTQTSYGLSLNLLGVQNMITEALAGDTPTITVANGNIFNTYSFVLGVSQVSTVTTLPASSLASSGPGSYFIINSGENVDQYYIWYQLGTSTDPMIAGRTGIEVVIQSGWTADQVASKTTDAINQFMTDFHATVVGDVVTITNLTSGYTQSLSDGNTGFTLAVTTPGTGEKVSVQAGTFTTVADVSDSLAGKYFTINSAFNLSENYVWFTVSGNGTDPAPAGLVGIQVALVTNDSAATVAQKIANTLNFSSSNSYNATNVTNTLTITNTRVGPANTPTVGTSGFTYNLAATGALQVELSTIPSPAQAVDATTDSLVRVMNRNPSETVYNYYISGAGSPPGQMEIQGRQITTPQFFIIANNSDTGLSFNPRLSPTALITDISVGSATTMVITTNTPHGLTNLDYAIMTGTNSTPIIDGIYQIEYLSLTAYRINVPITVAGNTGAVSNITNAAVSTNEVLVNRIYYSKLQQPEAVPLVNFIDVGANDKPIYRIFPIQNSLFVFKQDGLFRISGETAPFNLALFDLSCFLIAPDSVSGANSTIYAWTRQGITTVTESGTATVSRPVDVDILPLASNNYTNFSTATWAIGYESDNSYMAFTVSNVDDNIATQCYRLGTLTNTWTTFTKTNTCGIVHPIRDQLLLGSGYTNSIEQERKTFTRYDYADEEIDFTLAADSILNNTMRLPLDEVAQLKPNYVVTQTQPVGTYTFNMLLKKLDLDPGTQIKTYFSNIGIVAGDDMHLQLIELANTLDTDPGLGYHNYTTLISPKSGTITANTAANPTVITSAAHGLLTGRMISIAGSNSGPPVNGIYQVTVLDANTFTIPLSVITPGTTGSWTTQDENFQDILTVFNALVTQLNTDPGLSFKNYNICTNSTILETSILSINTVTGLLTLNDTLDFIVGPLVFYESIDCVVQYAPNVIGDPLKSKQLSEATIMFLNRAFTSATISFATDLLPAFNPVTFIGDGNGIFGMGKFGSGFFGGNSNSAPFRTYIPRNNQRCRYMIVKFEHNIAREMWSIYGITLTGNLYLSTRAYR